MTEVAMRAQPRAGPRAWVGLTVLASAAMVIAADMTVLHLAVPHLSADLAPSATQLLWIVDVYSFVIAGLLITMGALGDRFGRRRLLLLGAALFAVASAVAAFADSPAVLIAARALLGVAGAMLMPSTLSLVRTMFSDARQRGVAIAVWSAGFSSGATLGPVIGGAMLEHFWWGAVFLPAVPVMVLVVVLGPVLLSEHTSSRPARFDLPSAGLWLLTMLAVVYGLKQLAAGNSAGVTAPAVLVLLAGSTLGVVFVRRQRRLAEPLLDLSLLARPAFAAPLGAVLVATLGFAGAQFFIGQHLQALIGLSPLAAGLTLLPGAAASTAGTLVSPLLARKAPKLALVAGAMVVMAVGFGILAGLTATSDAVTVAVTFALLAIGFGPVLALGTDMMTGSVPQDRAGAAAGIVSTNGDLSVSLGVALLGSIGAAVYRGRLGETMPTGVPDAAAAAATDTIGAAVAAADRLPPATATALLDAAGEAFTAGVRVVGGVGAVTVLGVAAALVLLQHGVRRPAVDREPTDPGGASRVHAANAWPPGESEDDEKQMNGRMSCPSN